MGISDGKTALVSVSAHKSKIAPTIMETGISLRLSGPVTARVMCGTSRPTKPIIPETETQTAAIREAVTRSASVTFFVSTPSEEAVLLPRAIRLRSLAKKKDIKKPAHTNSRVS